MLGMKTNKATGREERRKTDEIIIHVGTNNLNAEIIEHAYEELHFQFYFLRQGNMSLNVKATKVHRHLADN